MPYFSARLDFPSRTLSVPGSPRIVLYIVSCLVAIKMSNSEFKLLPFLLKGFWEFVALRDDVPNLHNVEVIQNDITFREIVCYTQFTALR